jgi:hypothetical protein
MRLTRTQTVFTALTVLAAATVMSRRRRSAPGLGRIGKNDGYTYRFATQRGRHGPLAPTR